MDYTCHDLDIEPMTEFCLKNWYHLGINLDMGHWGIPEMIEGHVSYFTIVLLQTMYSYHHSSLFGEIAMLLEHTINLVFVD